MSRSRITTVDDLSTLSDEQLGEFMEKHHRPSGSFELPVDGWNKLSKRERDHLAERLRSIQRAVADNPAANSRPLDLDKLDALLRDMSSREDSASKDQPCERERRTETPDDPRELYKQSETEAYNNLVSDGGHPLYPLDLLESVSKDPDAFQEMLRPFWRQPRYDKPSEMDHGDARAVFRRQWHRWQNFRKWQLNNRGIDNEDDDEDFLAYVEKTKRDFIDVGWGAYAAEIEADPNCLKRPGETWHYIQRHRSWQRRYQRELGCKTFSDYEGAVKVRLARHGFTQPFQLAENPEQQEQLTTWIEYLGFEYWWLDRYTTSIESLKLKHDDAWIELKQQGMVKDDETPEFVRTEASARRRQADKDRAWKAVQDAESKAENAYQKTQKDPNRLDIPKEQRVQMLVKARRRLSKAREALDFTKRRSHLLIKFVRETFDYDDAKEDVVNQMKLLEWAVAETRSVEDEQKAVASEVASRTKRKESPANICAGQPNYKRQKLNGPQRGPRPSNDRISTRDRRPSRNRELSSTVMNRQFDYDKHSMQDTCLNQTKLGGRAVQLVPMIEAEPESVTLKGTSRKRKVEFENATLKQSSHKRLKPNTRGHCSGTSNNGAGGRVSRVCNRRTTDVSQQLDQHQSRSAQDTNCSSQSPGFNLPSRELTHGLRRSSRLAALRPEPARREIHVPGNLGSEYLPVEKILEKRIRRRGRGCITEYLVKFKGYDTSFNLWTSAQELPKNVTDGLDYLNA